MVTELNFPLNGTITAASTTHKPITSHGTHRPANRPGGTSPDDTASTAINSLLHPLPRSPDADFLPSEPETSVNTAAQPGLTNQIP
ncbi:hypothetical protein, partial [Actinoplanes sp. NBRC 103695]|uniref:hypothetical protein n=1 Tax=Actinoplanes sp. NBRC 103695 TaxID=3032202 RepID=UPI0025528563